MPQTNLALILDIETTGNKDEDELVEIGMVMLDVPSLHELGRLSAVVIPSKAGMKRIETNPVVLKMHETSGLLEDLRKGTGYSTWAQADERINVWLDQFTTERTHIPYGGSGVSHFDRKYIDKFLPRLASRLTYWSLDVGAARRIAALQGGKTHSIDAKTHRALDDALVHVEELRFYAGRALL